MTNPEHIDRAPRYRIGPRMSDEGTRLFREHLDAAGWTATAGDDWTLWWSCDTPAREVYRRLSTGRSVNHIPGIAALGRKDTLAWALEIERRSRPRGASRARIHPATWVMPEEHDVFVDAARRSPGAVWIQKPANSSNGAGIRLHAQADSVRPRRGTVVQRYLAEPHLLDGYKYTLRCYVAITWFEPPEVWLFDDGFAKLTSRPYTRAPERLSDRVVHLTNPAVQETNHEVPTSSRNLTHRAYRKLLRARGIDDSALFDGIAAIAATLVRAGLPFMRRESAGLPRDPGRCFDLLGLDVLVDHRMRPWLIECNLSPSLSVEADPTTPSARDEFAIKRRLVGDVLRLAGVLPAPIPRPRSRSGEPVSGFRRLPL